MASSSSSSSSSSNSPEERHEVFLSFRGDDDTRSTFTFTGHLHAAFKRLQIKTYVDYNLGRGDEISGALLNAIEDAKLSVIVFSKNFAASKLCLDQVAKIIECKKTREQIVVPIFYDVDPKDVRNQTGSFGSALARHEKRFWADGQSKVQNWRAALTDAANHSGWDCNVDRVESELVEAIAKDILQKLESINNGLLERRITMQKQIVQQKLDKSRRSGSLSDIEDMTAAMQQLGDLKLEKALRMDDSSVWDDLMETYEHVLQLKLNKFKRTLSAEDLEDFGAAMKLVMQLQRERPKSNHKHGIRGI